KTMTNGDFTRDGEGILNSAGKSERETVGFGFLNTLRNAVLAHRVLKLVLQEIHPRLLDNQVDRVDGGFTIIMGGYWEQFGCDDTRFLRRMGPVLAPLLEVGGRAYMAYMATDSTRKPAVNPGSKKRYPADLQLAYNARAVQVFIQSPPQPRNMYESDSEISIEESEEEEEEPERKSEAQEKEFEREGVAETSPQPEVPRPPSQEELVCTRLLRSSRQLFASTIQVKSSPERFSAQVMVAPNSTEDTHEDIYDWEQEWMQSGILPESSPGLPLPPQVLRVGGRSSMGFALTLELSLDAIPAGALICVYIF
ncbi:hypothetical protein DFH09DRAFT_1180227, partial [Mycena vulgaris]